MYNVGDMVCVHVRWPAVAASIATADHLGFITDICTHIHHRNDSRCIEITYLKPRVSEYHGGLLMKTHLISSPYTDVSPVSSTETKTKE
jgi:hypothetical protein